MISIITFDLWNTIIHNHSYFERRLEVFNNFLNLQNYKFDYNLLREKFNTAFYLSGLDIEEINYQHIYTSQRIRRLATELEISITPSLLVELQDQLEKLALEDPPSLKRGAKKVLRKLSESKKIGLISNTGITPGKILDNILENHDVLKYFDITTYSDEVGVYKPHPEIFRTTLKSLNSETANCIHIGDILDTDIKGAINYGMKAIWITSQDEKDDSLITPDYKVKNLEDILPILNEIGR